MCSFTSRKTASLRSTTTRRGATTANPFVVSRQKIRHWKRPGARSQRPAERPGEANGRPPKRLNRSRKPRLRQSLASLAATAGAYLAREVLRMRVLVLSCSFAIVVTSIATHAQRAGGAPQASAQFDVTEASI